MKTKAQIYEFIKTSTGRLYAMTEHSSHIPVKTLFKSLIRESETNKNIKIVNNDLIIVDNETGMYIYTFNN